MKRSASSKAAAVDQGEESFFQIQDQAVPYVDKLAAAHPNAFRVLWWLMGQANQQNKLIADQTRIGKELSLHRNTVSIAVAELRRQGFLETYKAGTTTGYILNAWVIWRDGRSKRAGAPFMQSLNPQVKVTPTQPRAAKKVASPQPFRTSSSTEFPWSGPSKAEKAEFDNFINEQVKFEAAQALAIAQQKPIPSRIPRALPIEMSMEQYEELMEFRFGPKSK